MKPGKERRDVTVGFATSPDAVARLELTSNEWMQKAGELEAEIERLRMVEKARDAATGEAARWMSKFQDAEAEVERLHGTNVYKLLHEAEAEVERLRGDLDRQRERVREYQHEVERLRRIEEAARAVAFRAYYVINGKPRLDFQGEDFDALRAALEEKP